VAFAANKLEPDALALFPATLPFTAAALELEIEAELLPTLLFPEVFAETLPEIVESAAQIPK
jgi:hypothetical protein